GQDSIRDWLAGEYESLTRKLEAVRGKAEYGVQLFWEPRTVARDIAARSEAIRRLEEEVRSKPKGTAYLLRQRVESILRREMETRASECFQDFRQRVQQHVCDIRLEKTRKAGEDKQMIANLSCLVHREKSSELGKELEAINGMEGFSVRFTGPWPPYSFVDR
ncbi:MAG: GvpL/GvpF family gas vesicle protein, partial [Dehalococcoidia bacterium]|nr:GvpL/GvpF family gas vesicle protein [Dehalococcoidia bacterium]